MWATTALVTAVNTFAAASTRSILSRLGASLGLLVVGMALASTADSLLAPDGFDAGWWYAALSLLASAALTVAAIVRVESAW